MSRSNSKTKFKALQKVWYDKLAKSGFEDIERDEENLKFPLINKFSESEKETYLEHWKAQRDYYYMATHFLNSYKFETKLEEIIWAYHAEGISVRDIAKLLNRVKKEKTNRTSVWQIIKKLEKTMKTLLWAETVEMGENDQ